MEGGQPPKRQASSQCFPCFALKGEHARVPAHEQLRMVGTAVLQSGTREEFVCDVCGQRMIRFLATQTSPPPSDRWRFESAARPSLDGIVTPVADPAVQPVDEMPEDSVTEVDPAPADASDVGVEDSSALLNFIHVVE
jgi:hypothetical protein